MNKVISIHLNGNACQVEERGYAALRDYLDEAARQLASHPDMDEVLLDLEQAIADKCRRFLRADKNVVLNDEIERIIEEMGPVHDMETSADGAAGAHPDAGADSSEGGARPRQPRRLYRLKHDRMVEGICAGIGAYLGVDPTIIRAVTVVLLILSSGTVAVVYFVLVFVIPEAKTPEEHAAAHGAPFDASEVLERARANLRGLQRSSEQRHQRRSQAAYWQRLGEPGKGGLGVILTIVAFIIGVSIVTQWLRWPFHSPFVQTTLIGPHRPWAPLVILAVLILGLGILVRRLARSERGAGTLLYTVLNFSLVILVLMFVVYLFPLAIMSAVQLWSALSGFFGH